jgi:signal transduction histidine kinase
MKFKSKVNENGAGLGLYLVKKICDSLDILISFESAKDIGTRFKLVFERGF